MPWNGGLVAINNYGFGGANAHLVIRSNPKPKHTLKMKNSLPNIVAVSGRTISAVHKFLDRIEEHENDYDLLGLVRNIHSNNINGHGYRGYQILDKTEKIQEVSQVSSEKRPIW